MAAQAQFFTKLKNFCGHQIENCLEIIYFWRFIIKRGKIATFSTNLSLFLAFTVFTSIVYTFFGHFQSNASFYFGFVASSLIMKVTVAGLIHSRAWIPPSIKIAGFWTPEILDLDWAWLKKGHLCTCVGSNVDSHKLSSLFCDTKHLESEDICNDNNSYLCSLE